MNDRFVAKRFFHFIIIFLVTLAASLIMCPGRNMFGDELIEIAFLDTIFCLMLFWLLEKERLKLRLSEDKEHDFGQIMTGYILMAGYTVIISWLPEFLKPVILLPFVMAALSNTMIAMCTSLFLTFMMCLITGSSTQEILMYGIVLLCGVMLAEALEEKRLRIWGDIILFALSAMLPGIFYYFLYRESKPLLFIAGGGCALIPILFVHLFYDRLLLRRKNELTDKLADLTAEEHPVARELRKFSKAEYAHAKRVSRIAAQCALLVDADAQLCAAAGMFYRIGIIEGEPLAESGVRIAQSACFPEDVIRIIYEYGGENELPSTVESAIIHMVDGLMIKMEVLKEQSTSSQWNQDMIIYQTLNDFSAKGIYDRSGLSMNMFLKIREYLVKEEALL